MSENKIILPEDTKLGLYECHKFVGGAEIVEIRNNEDEVSKDAFPCLIYLKNNEDTPVPVSQAAYDKFCPVVGGFLVQYEDGYVSFSPREAFIKGYTLCAVTTEDGLELNTAQDTTQEVGNRSTANIALMGVYKRVSEMNNAFGNKPFLEGQFNLQRLISQCKNIPDEINELEKAVNAINKSVEELSMTPDIYKEQLEHIRDALCDVMVFGFGKFHFVNANSTYVSENVTIFMNRNVQVIGPQYSEKLIVNIEATITALRIIFAKLSKGFETLAGEPHDENGEYDEDLYCELIVEPLSRLLAVCWSNLEMIGADPATDMHSVMDGVFSRFIKDQDDADASIAHWANQGVPHVAIEGQFPKAILRSLSDQPDAPKGKFLKAVSTKLPVFVDILSTEAA